MNGVEAGQYVNSLCVAILIVRLVTLGLFSVYRVFSCFLIFEIFQSVLFLALSKTDSFAFDYRIIWSVCRPIFWILLLATVYSLLSAVLKSLPGILKFSRTLLAAVFVAAICIGLFTVFPEYSALSAQPTAGYIRRIFLICLVVDRAVTMSAFMVLLSILLFVLWFPVSLPRNLLVFSIGLVVYLGSKTTLLLATTYLRHAQNNFLTVASALITAILSVCFVCWATLVSRAGQKASVTVGHSWEAAEQDRLIIKLEAMNNSLLRARQ